MYSEHCTFGHTGAVNLLALLVHSNKSRTVFLKTAAKQILISYKKNIQDVYFKRSIIFLVPEYITGSSRESEGLSWK